LHAKKIAESYGKRKEGKRKMEQGEKGPSKSVPYIIRAALPSDTGGERRRAVDLKRRDVTSGREGMGKSRRELARKSRDVSTHFGTNRPDFTCTERKEGEAGTRSGEE